MTSLSVLLGLDLGAGDMDMDSDPPTPPPPKAKTPEKVPKKEEKMEVDLTDDQQKVNSIQQSILVNFISLNWYYK